MEMLLGEEQGWLELLSTQTSKGIADANITLSSREGHPGIDGQTKCRSAPNEIRMK